MGKTILHREISDRRLGGIFLLVHVSTELGIGAIKLSDELFVLTKLNELVVTYDVEQHDGVRLSLVPSFIVDVTEDVLCI